MSSGRPRQRHRACGAVLLGAPNPLFDLVYRLEIFGQLGAIAGAERFLQPGDFFEDRVQNVAGLPNLRVALRRRARLTEQPLEHHPRMRLHGQRRCRRLPRNRVRKKAVLGIAANLCRALEAQLERRQPRVLAERAGGDLIDGRREPYAIDTAAAPVPRVHTRQPHGGSAGMIAVSVAEVVCLPVRETAQHRDAIANGSQWAQDRRQLEVLPRRGGDPHRLNRAVWNVDESKPDRRLDGSRRQRRNHRIQERQRNRCAHPAQKSPPRQSSLGDDHDVCLRNYEPRPSSSGRACC